MKLNKNQIKKFNNKFNTNAYSVIVQILKDDKVKVIINCVHIIILDKSLFKDILKD